MPGSLRSSAPDRCTTRRLILIVDDEPSVRAMVSASLRVGGSRYQVVEAGTAAEAIARAESAQPDLVLLDVALPAPDGFWVCRMLKSGASTPHTPLLILNAL